MILALYLREIDRRGREGQVQIGHRVSKFCDTARLRNHLWFEGITYQVPSRRWSR